MKADWEVGAHERRVTGLGRDPWHDRRIIRPMKREHVNRYGTAAVPSDLTPGVVLEVSAIDLLSRGLDPRPLFSERRWMETMGPVRLGLHLIVRAIYFRLPNTRLTRAMWGAYRG